MLSIRTRGSDTTLAFRFAIDVDTDTDVDVDIDKARRGMWRRERAREQRTQSVVRLMRALAPHQSGRAK